MRYGTAIGPQTGGAVAAILVALACVGWAADPTPTPAATTTPTPDQQTLSDVAKQIKLEGQPARTPGAGIVITNDNIGDYANKGKLSSVSSTGAPPPLPAGGPGGSASGPEEAKREAWRSRYANQLQVVEELENNITRLDSEIPLLWNQFYSWDDPAYRDSVIKPKLDAALAEREGLERSLAEERAKLPEILEQARRDGAQPGWFRDMPR